MLESFRPHRPPESGGPLCFWGTSRPCSAPTTRLFAIGGWQDGRLGNNWPTSEECRRDSSRQPLHSVRLDSGRLLKGYPVTCHRVRRDRDHPLAIADHRQWWIENLSNDDKRGIGEPTVGDAHQNRSIVSLFLWHRANGRRQVPACYSPDLYRLPANRRRFRFRTTSTVVHSVRVLAE